MQIYRTIADLQLVLAFARQKGQSIGLAPTMGNLHAGHLTLVTQAKKECNFVLATIFVNPTQFGPGEDLAAYPRTFAEDIAALEQIACDGVFAPAVEEIYPAGAELETKVSVPSLSKLHCGTSRPGHFDGVCTIVTKLLNICQPDKAYFGEKDYQQLCIIRKLVRDLNMPVKIIGVATQRAESGLALSSRNNYLSAEQQQQASILHTTLRDTAALLRNEEQPDFSAVEKKAIQTIEAVGLRPDYFSICDPESLLPARPDNQRFRILTAAYLGKTRLIDNIAVDFIN